ncbi:hypothetical protein BH23GEM11_BH23GEM11_04320 [soil metagenome]
MPSVPVDSGDCMAALDAPPPARRYSEEEFRRILRKATSEPARRPEDAAGAAPGAEGAEIPEGLTLDTIREIAWDVGISGTAVDRAAANLDNEIFVQGPGSEGDAGPGLWADFRIPRRLNEAEIRVLLLEAERILGGASTRERMRDGVRWMDAEKRVAVKIVRGSGATTVRASADHGKHLLGDWARIAFVGLGGIAVAWLINPWSLLLVGPLALVAAVAGMLFYRLGTRSIARDQVRDLLEELRLAVSPDEAPPR